MHLVQHAIFDRFEYITFHIFEKEVNIVFILRGNDFLEFDDIGMTEFSEEGDFAIDALCICFVLEG